MYKLKGGRQLVIFVQFLFNMGRFDVGGCVKLWVEGLMRLKELFFCKYKFTIKKKIIFAQKT